MQVGDYVQIQPVQPMPAETYGIVGQIAVVGVDNDGNRAYDIKLPNGSKIVAPAHAVKFFSPEGFATDSWRKGR